MSKNPSLTVKHLKKGRKLWNVFSYASNDEFVNTTVSTRFIEENPQLFDFQPSQNRLVSHGTFTVA